MRAYLAIVLSIALVAIVGCGGKGHTSTAANSTHPLVGGPVIQQLPALPPASPFVAQRIASTAQLQLAGTDTFAVSPAGAFVQGNAMRLQSASVAASSAGGWAMYQFNGVPGEKLEAVGLDSILFSHPSGQTIWVGISNYSQQRWDWLDAGNGINGEVALSGPAGAYAGAGGQTYIIVLAYGGMDFAVNSLYLRYTSRQQVSGTVESADGTPIPGALVASTAFQQSVLTGSDGSFTLGLPNGSWPLVVTKDTYTFYSNPAMVTVAGSPLTGIVITGRQNGSHFTGSDPLGNNDTFATATPLTLDTPHSEALSVIDDATDYYSFSVAAPGQYFVEFTNPGLDLYFPYLALYRSAGLLLASAPSPVAGTVRVPLLVVTPGDTFRLKVTAAGGGGNYSVRLSSGVSQHLHGLALSPTAAPLDGCLITATTTGQGDVTEYFTAQDGSFDDYYRAPVQTTLKPSGAYLTFSPPQQSVDLSIGDQLGSLFTGSSTVIGDAYEPNGDPADATVNAVLTLPYDSVAKNDHLSVSAGSDVQDYYRVTPAAGLGLKAELTSDADDVTSAPLGFSILHNNGFTTLATGHPTAQGMEVRLPTLTDGNAYYVVVSYQTISQRTRAYGLKIGSFTAYPLHVNVQYNAQGVGNAIVQLRRPADATSPLAYFVDQLKTNTAGVAPTTFYAAGEELQAELLRYGFGNDRQTQHIVMPASALNLTFNADPAQSADQDEPNDTSGAPAVLAALPVTLKATLDPITDPKDYYKLDLDGVNPVTLTLTQSVSQGGLHVALDDMSGAVISSGTIWPGAQSIVLDAALAHQCLLEVDNAGAPGAYQLDISNVPEYHLTGSAVNGVTFVNNMVLYCPELQSSAAYDSGSQIYDFGYVVPGIYTIQAYAMGQTATPTEATVVVSNANAGQDFTFAAHAVDGLEPNDTSATAAALPADGSVSATLSIGSSGMPGDSEDWYKFDATAGQIVEVRCSRGAAWWPTLTMDVYDPGATLLGSPAPNGADQILTFVATTTGTYTVNVYGGTVEYTMKVSTSG